MTFWLPSLNDLISLISFLINKLNTGKLFNCIILFTNLPIVVHKTQINVENFTSKLAPCLLDSRRQQTWRIDKSYIKMSTPENAEVPPTEGQNNKPEIEITTADDRLARQIVEVMVEKGIKVLALDFDKTIIAIHTAGFWTEPTAKLAEYVRPCFKALIKAALDTRLHLCIVTYSMQPALISDLIHMVLPNW